MWSSPPSSLNSTQGATPAAAAGRAPSGPGRRNRAAPRAASPLGSRRAARRRAAPAPRWRRARRSPARSARKRRTRSASRQQRRRHPAHLRRRVLGDQHLARCLALVGQEGAEIWSRMPRRRIAAPRASERWIALRCRSASAPSPAPRQATRTALRHRRRGHRASRRDGAVAASTSEPSRRRRAAQRRLAVEPARRRSLPRSAAMSPISSKNAPRARAGDDRQRLRQPAGRICSARRRRTRSAASASSSPRAALVHHGEIAAARRLPAGSGAAATGRRRGSSRSCMPPGQSSTRGEQLPRARRISASARNRPVSSTRSCASRPGGIVVQAASRSLMRLAISAAAARVKVRHRMPRGVGAVEHQRQQAVGQHLGLAGAGRGGDPDRFVDRVPGAALLVGGFARRHGSSLRLHAGLSTLGEPFEVGVVGEARRSSRHRHGDDRACADRRSGRSARRALRSTLSISCAADRRVAIGKQIPAGSPPGSRQYSSAAATPRQPGEAALAGDRAFERQLRRDRRPRSACLARQRRRSCSRS